MAYTPRAFTTTEVNNAQIEKELASIVFGVWEITLWKKGLYSNWPQTLGVYYEEESAECSEEAAKNAITVTEVWAYSKGNEMHIADTLSNAYLLSTKDDEKVK